MVTNNTELSIKHQDALSLHHLVRDIVRNHLQEQQHQGLLEKLEAAIHLAFNGELNFTSLHRAADKVAVNARNIH